MKWMEMVNILVGGVQGNRMVIATAVNTMAPTVVSVRKVSGNRKVE
jgi:hypothetical protein